MAVSPRARLIFATVMISWMLFPLLLWGRLAVDAVPLIAGGRVAAVDPGDLYVVSTTDPYGVSPRFHDESCRAIPEGEDCEQYIHPYTHPPMVLPLVVIIGKLPTDVAVLFYRLVGALALAGGMMLLWRRLASRSGTAAPMLASSAVLLTPFAVATIALAQSSPLLFLSVCVGVSATRTNKGAAVVGGLWASTIVMKAYPAAVGVVALLQRRWRLLLWAGAWCAALLVGAAAIGGTRIFGDFAGSTKVVRLVSFPDPYNRGIDGLIHAAVPSWNGDSLAFALSVLVRLGVLVALWRARIRRASADVQWAFGWAAILWFIPVVWFHYYWVIVGAAFLIAGDRLPREPRWAWMFPSLAALIALGSLADVQSTASVVVCGLALVAAVPALAFLSVPRPADAPAPADAR